MAGESKGGQGKQAGSGKKAGAAAGRGGHKGRAAKGASAATVTAEAGKAVAPRLRERYRSEIVEQLMQQFKFSSRMQVPRLVKITLNAGLGEAVANPNLVKTMTEELSIIAGQRAVACKAKKSIANFKLREGQPIGCMVTLRRERMWEFLDRLISVAMPRIRDFSGLNPRAFDGRGNFSCGMSEQIMFPEIDYDKVGTIKGFNISIVTTAANDAEGSALLRLLGMPLKRPAQSQEG